MAIVLSTRPQNVYPAYNDSIIQFVTTLENYTYAEVGVYNNSDFPDPFVIWPDADGVFTFNLKHIFKVLAGYDFRDTNFNTAVWSENISGIFLMQDFTIDVYFSDAQSELTNLLTCFFSKAVKQPGDDVYTEQAQILAPTTDGINYYMTYFEGFPFHFDILKIIATEELKIVSLNTSNQIDSIFPSVSESYRFNIDRGGSNNWTMDTILPLTENLNRLEFYADDVFKANLLITKKKVCSGIYLKWWNRAGGFSHYLFEKFYEQKVTSSNDGYVQNTDMDNIENYEGGKLSGLLLSTGKVASDTITIRAKFESYEYELLKDLFVSPAVQMYTSKIAYEEGEFIDVEIDGTMSYSNKRGKNQLIATIKLPGMITAKL